ncbi:ChrR family anti-sigma-E factor [Alteromonas sp. D210916BOD_24]|uniref:ChrR family anti-sigma-E factor n=1 Tax=Alteromonas sp. D210916BOD_24 TaxID=3157618 RepID=UPI00399D3FB5
MIKFHPARQQLRDFVEGALPPTISLVVSAHCDMCSQCQSLVETETERLAAHMVLSSPRDSNLSREFGDMISQITQLPSSLEVDDKRRMNTSQTSVDPAVRVGSRVIDAATIELDGRVFHLPRTLQRYIDKTGNWSSLVGKLWQAPVDFGNQGVANFIYMGKGGSVPEHTHRGTEYTLVIDGEFSDGLHHYDTGDFIFMDGDKTHTPRTDAKEGCLVFSIVDQPLHFTSGLARLLNPFSHLFFR